MAMKRMTKAMIGQPSSPPPLPGLIRAHRGELVNDMGRRVFLRGANVGGKLPLGHYMAKVDGASLEDYATDAYIIRIS